MKKSLVSVVIPTYNRAKELNRAIKSVLKQTYKKWELIIVDDGSTDDTKKVVQNYMKKYKKKIKYLYQRNKGQGAARNYGIKRAKGEFIAFLDSDDEWLPEKLEKQIKLFSNPNIGLAYSASNLNKGPFYRGKVLMQLINKNFITNSSVVIRRKVLKKSGYFGEEDWLRNIEDYDLWLRIALNFEFDYINKPLVKYYQTNKYTNKMHIVNYEKLIKMWKKYLKNKKFERYKLQIIYNILLLLIKKTIRILFEITKTKKY